jgi:hypothetical protein
MAPFAAHLVVDLDLIPFSSSAAVSASYFKISSSEEMTEL